VIRVFAFVQKSIVVCCLAIPFVLAGSLAQQARPAAQANPAIDLPDVVAEVKAAFDAYEKAVQTNNTAVLDSSFRNDPRTIRYGNAENLYGYDEIHAFRVRSTGGGPRTLSKTVITTYGRDFAVVSTLTHRAAAPSKVGRQMQTWVRFADGWRVVAASVSTIDIPPGEK
jgi:1-carboxybiuret hydrolase subunit AtzH-like protein